jgi:hypothetical protein
MGTQTLAIQVRRERWNNLIRAAGFALWIFPMARFWMRFFPPMRPFDFHVPAPPWSLLIAGLALCAVPYALPTHWFRPLSFERSQFYPRLGVRLFRLLAPDGDLVNRQLRKLDSGYRVIRNRSDLGRHIAEGIIGERLHLAFLLAGFSSAAYAWRLGEAGLSTALVFGNIVYNLYPVLHHRYKRARLAHSLRAGSEPRGQR